VNFLTAKKSPSWRCFYSTSFRIEEGRKIGQGAGRKRKYGVVDFKGLEDAIAERGPEGV